MKRHDAEPGGFHFHPFQEVAAETPAARLLNNEQFVDKGIPAAKLDAVPETQGSIADHLAQLSNQPDPPQ